MVFPSWEGLGVGFYFLYLNCYFTQHPIKVVFYIKVAEPDYPHTKGFQSVLAMVVLFLMSLFKMDGTIYLNGQL